MNSLNKIFLKKENYKNHNWLIIDCKGHKLGRMSTIITAILKGKLKPDYFPSADKGDFVILINADSIILNEKNKHYIVNHPGRPGHSLKIKKVSESLPKFTIQRAVRGMLARNEKKKLMKRLKIYSGSSHPHQAQNPIEFNIFRNVETSKTPKLT